MTTKGLKRLKIIKIFKHFITNSVATHFKFIKESCGGKKLTCFTQIY